MIAAFAIGGVLLVVFLCWCAYELGFKHGWDARQSQAVSQTTIRRILAEQAGVGEVTTKPYNWEKTDA